MFRSARDRLFGAAGVRLLCASVLGLTPTLWHAMASGSSASDSHVIHRMDEFYKHLSALYPVLFSQEKFAEKSAEKVIGDHLKALVEEAKGLEEKKEVVGNFGGRVALQVLKSTFSEANASFHRGGKEYSRYLMRSSVHACISCHTSGMNSRTLNLGSEKAIEGSLVTEIDRIEFLITTRQFDQARERILRYLASYPANGADWVDMHAAFFHLGVYHARLFPDPKEGYATFRRFAANKAYPMDVREELGDWAQGFRSWEEELGKNAKDRGGKSKSFAAFLKDVRQSIGYQEGRPLLDYDAGRLVARLRYLGELNRRVEEENKATPQERAQALHLIGLIHNVLDQSFLLNLDSAYFKLCIETVPHSTLSQRCYQSLRDAVFGRHTGSSGTHLDAQDEVELDQYRQQALPKK